MIAATLSFSPEDLELVSEEEKESQKRFVYVIDSKGRQKIEWKGAYNQDILELSGYVEIGIADDGLKVLRRRDY